MVYHVLNRANARLPTFKKLDDYLAFESILAEAKLRQNMRILGYCLMPNHWHLLLWPREDSDLSDFTVQDNDHFYTGCRYVERNALRASLVFRSRGLAMVEPVALGTRPSGRPPPAR